MSRQQGLSLRDPGIKGPLWISKQTFPAPDESSDSDVLDALEVAIHALAADESEKAFTRPAIGPVEIEWTGHRSGHGVTHVYRR